MESEKEYNQEPYLSMSLDHTRRRKFYYIDQQLKQVALENPELGVTWNEKLKHFLFYNSFFYNINESAVKLQIDYNNNGDIDKEYLNRMILVTVFNLGIKYQKNQTIEKLKYQMDL